MTRFVGLKIGLMLFGMLAILTLRSFGAVLFLVVDCMAVVYVYRHTSWHTRSENPLGILLLAAMFGTHVLALVMYLLLRYVIPYDTALAFANMLEQLILLPGETQFSALLKVLAGTPVSDIPFYQGHSKGIGILEKFFNQNPQHYLSQYLSFMSFSIWFPALSSILLEKKVELAKYYDLSGDIFARVLIMTIIALIVSTAWLSVVNVTMPTTDSRETLISTSTLWIFSFCISFSLPVLFISWRNK